MVDDARKRTWAAAYGIGRSEAGHTTSDAPPRSPAVTAPSEPAEQAQEATRAQMCEQRLRDSYPQILRDAGLDEAMIEELMAAYDSPVIETENPVSEASRYAPYEPPRRPSG